MSSARAREARRSHIVNMPAKAHAASGALQRERMDRLPVITSARQPHSSSHETASEISRPRSTLNDSAEVHLHHHHEELLRLQGREVARMVGEKAGMKSELAELRQQQNEEIKLKNEQVERLHQQYKLELKEERRAKDEQVERLRQQHTEQVDRLRQQHAEEIQRKDKKIDDAHRDLVAMLKAASNNPLLTDLLPVEQNHTRALAEREAASTIAQRQRAPTIPAVARTTAAATAPRARRVVQWPSASTNATSAVSAETIASQLGQGGDGATTTLTGALEHALSLIEVLALHIPRRQRKTVKALCDRLETALDESGGVLVDQLVLCDPSELRQLGRSLSMVYALNADELDVEESVVTVEHALDELWRYGDAIIGAGRQLVAPAAGVRLLGLQAIRSLPRIVLEETVETEVELIPVLQEIGVTSDASRSSCAEREAAFLGIFAVALRNPATSAWAIRDISMEHFYTIAEDLHWGRLDGREGVRILAAAGSVSCVTIDVIGKSDDAAIRAPLEDAVMKGWKTAMKMPYATTKQRFEELRPHLLQGLADNDDIELAAGVGAVINSMLYLKDHDNVIDAVTVQASLLPQAALALHRRVTGGAFAPLEWWKARAQVVSLETACLHRIWIGMVNLGSKLGQHWQHEDTLAEAAHLMKINQAAGLSAQARAPAECLHYAFIIVNYSARIENKREMIRSIPGCVDALSYAAANEFVIWGRSMSSYAYQILVTLIGRNENGMTLSKDAVDGVLDTLHDYFGTDGDTWVRGSLPVSSGVYCYKRIRVHMHTYMYVSM